MAILKVARMGHPVLRAKAQAVSRAEVSAPAFQRLIDDMIETMVEYRGVGLAAPQIHESLRLFVAVLDSDDDEGGTPIAIINPEITPLSAESAEDWEGCLSIPDIRGRVPRARHILVRGLDRLGERIEIRASDYPARVMQHETDHLDGILFFDRMNRFDSLTFLDEFARYWAKRGDEDE
jgi:peptide deformylase